MLILPMNLRIKMSVIGQLNFGALIFCKISSTYRSRYIVQLHTSLNANYLEWRAWRGQFQENNREGGAVSYEREEKRA